MLNGAATGMRLVDLLLTQRAQPAPGDDRVMSNLYAAKTVASRQSVGIKQHPMLDHWSAVQTENATRRRSLAAESGVITVGARKMTPESATSPDHRQLSSSVWSSAFDVRSTPPPAAAAISLGSGWTTMTRPGQIVADSSSALLARLLQRAGQQRSSPPTAADEDDLLGRVVDATWNDDGLGLGGGGVVAAGGGGGFNCFEPLPPAPTGGWTPNAIGQSHQPPAADRFWSAYDVCAADPASSNWPAAADNDYGALVASPAPADGVGGRRRFSMLSTSSWSESDPGELTGGAGLLGPSSAVWQHGQRRMPAATGGGGSDGCQSLETSPRTPASLWTAEPVQTADFDADWSPAMMTATASSTFEQPDGACDDDFYYDDDGCFGVNSLTMFNFEEVATDDVDEKDSKMADVQRLNVARTTAECAVGLRDGLPAGRSCSLATTADDALNETVMSTSCYVDRSPSVSQYAQPMAFGYCPRADGPLPRYGGPPPASAVVDSSHSEVLKLLLNNRRQPDNATSNSAWPPKFNAPEPTGRRQTGTGRGSGTTTRRRRRDATQQQQQQPPPPPPPHHHHQQQQLSVAAGRSRTDNIPAMTRSTSVHWSTAHNASAPARRTFSADDCVVADLLDDPFGSAAADELLMLNGSFEAELASAAADVDRYESQRRAIDAEDVMTSTSLLTGNEDRQRDALTASLVEFDRDPLGSAFATIYDGVYPDDDDDAQHALLPSSFSELLFSLSDFDVAAASPGELSSGNGRSTVGFDAAADGGGGGLDPVR